MEQSMPATLHVVVVKEEGYWIAQCLEYDMVAKSKKREDLPERFAIMFFSHVEVRARAGQEPFVGIPEAPAKYWNVFEDGKGLNLDVNRQVGFQTPPRTSDRNIAMPHLEARVA